MGCSGLLGNLSAKLLSLQAPNSKLQATKKIVNTFFILIPLILIYLSKYFLFQLQRKRFIHISIFSFLHFDTTSFSVGVEIVHYKSNKNLHLLPKKVHYLIARFRLNLDYTGSAKTEFKLFCTTKVVSQSSSIIHCQSTKSAMKNVSPPKRSCPYGDSIYFDNVL